MMRDAAVVEPESDSNQAREGRPRRALVRATLSAGSKVRAPSAQQRATERSQALSLLFKYTCSHSLLRALRYQQSSGTFLHHVNASM